MQANLTSTWTVLFQIVPPGSKAVTEHCYEMCQVSRCLFTFVSGSYVRGTNRLVFMGLTGWELSTFIGPVTYLRMRQEIICIKIKHDQEELKCDVKISGPKML